MKPTSSTDTGLSSENGARAHKLISSPLQGFTDHRFRNAFQKYFGGVDLYYAPYIRLNGKMVIKPGYERDILPKNNTTVKVCPQIMTNSAEEFLFVADFVKGLGYDEINWNLGCPYPMVVNRCMGSGLISEPDRVDEILERVHGESDIRVSMKVRMGYHEPTEILRLLPVLEKYPIRSVAIHARIGAQLYVGGVDLESFGRCLEHTDLPIHFNGDITTVGRFEEMCDRFPTIDHWLIGRGLIADPFLPKMIQSGLKEYPADRVDRFSRFHDTLMADLAGSLKGEKQLIMKMLHYWEYFAQSMRDSHRIVKSIKKTKTIAAYDEAVARIIGTEEYWGELEREGAGGILVGKDVV